MKIGRDKGKDKKIQAMFERRTETWDNLNCENSVFFINPVGTN